MQEHPRGRRVNATMTAPRGCAGGMHQSVHGRQSGDNPLMHAFGLPHLAANVDAVMWALQGDTGDNSSSAQHTFFLTCTTRCCASTSGSYSSGTLRSIAGVGSDSHCEYVLSMLTKPCVANERWSCALEADRLTCRGRPPHRGRNRRESSQWSQSGKGDSALPAR